MPSQDEHPASDAHVQTRRTGGVLTPLSDNSINSLHAELHGGKKRKRDGNTMEDLLKDPFVVRPYPSTIHAKPRTLYPLALLPRSHLPLSSLDLLSSTAPLPHSRLFETHVKILELEERMGSQPMVLIARLDDGHTLYAVEREDRGLYVLCQLGSWINVQQLRAAAIASKVESLPKTTERPIKDNDLVPLITPELSKYSKKKRLAIEAIQSMLKRPSAGVLSESQPAQATQLLSASKNQDQLLSETVVNDVSVQLTAVEIFENLRNQYFEALYSKASLAYFPKGPLSRARAAFHLDYDSTLDMNDHITFLKSMIMTTKLIDKKYSDGVPSCVSLLDVQGHSGDEAHQGAEKTKKRRSSHKVKPGKDGLYPMEDNLIRRYWAGLEDEAESGAPSSSREERTKSRIAQLRIRETQLQIIVILEVLALQTLAPTTENIGSDLPAALPTSANVDGKQKGIKSKRPDQLNMLIDVHLDRLCIWQDIAAEATHSALGDFEGLHANGSALPLLPKHTDNVLRDFCVEVIGPFFSARLPDRCITINSKLGGPVVVSPPKARLTKSASFSGAISRPGAATKRPIPARSRQSLKRVLTDEREREGRSVSHGRGRSMSLMRSATAPIIPGLKREASEAPSLSVISAVDMSLKANRPGVFNSKRFSQREVDLSSLVPEVNPKIQRKLNIEAELKEAISALKKPDRQLAGKCIVETAEKRVASASHSRKSKKPVRNPLFQGVQISATPRMNRQKDVFSQAQDPTLLEMVANPSSSLPRVPQSAALGERYRNPTLSAVHATPTRKAMLQSQSPNSLLVLPVVDYGGHLSSSPLKPRRSVGELFAAVPDSAVKTGSCQAINRGIQETPIKRRVEATWDNQLPALTPRCDEDNHHKKEVSNVRINIGSSQRESIYESLGWDDADGLDELS